MTFDWPCFVNHSIRIQRYVGRSLMSFDDARQASDYMPEGKMRREDSLDTRNLDTFQTRLLLSVSGHRTTDPRTCDPLAHR